MKEIVEKVGEETKKLCKKVINSRKHNVGLRLVSLTNLQFLVFLSEIFRSQSVTARVCITEAFAGPFADLIGKEIHFGGRCEMILLRGNTVRIINEYVSKRACIAEYQTIWLFLNYITGVHSFLDERKFINKPNVQLVVNCDASVFYENIISELIKKGYSVLEISSVSEFSSMTLSSFLSSEPPRASVFLLKSPCFQFLI